MRVMTTRTTDTHLRPVAGLPARLALWAVALGAWSLLAAAGALAGLDQSVWRWATAHRTAGLDVLLRAVTFFGSSVVTAAALPALAWRTWRRDGRGMALAWLAVFSAGLAVQIVLRFAVGQWRPDAGALPATMSLLARFQLAGFPSGHAYRSAFLFGWLATTLRSAAARGACVALIVVVGLTRVYLQRHWLSDVAGSWLLALAVFAAWRAWGPRLAQRLEAALRR